MRRILNIDFLIPLILLLLSLTFRVTNLDLIEFKTDEAVNLLLAARPALHHSLPFGGTVSSIGILNPPLFNYLLTPLAFFTLDPKIFSFLIALVNVLSIFFFYLIVKKYYGRVIAFTSSVLFALSPWAILYSRKIWNQDLLVPFFILMFYSVHKIIEEKNSFFWAPFALSSLFLIQLHQISILFVSILLLLLIRSVRINFKYLLIGGILGTIPLLPFLNYEIKNGSPDLRAIFSSQQRLSSNRSLSLFLRPLQITGQGNFSFILGNDLDTFVKKFNLIDKLRRLFYAEYILIILGILLCVKKLKSSRLLAYSAISLPFLYFLLKIDSFMHYYIIILPLLFLFLGISFEFLFKKNKLFIFLFLALIISSIAFNFAFFQLLKEKGNLRGDYGDSLRNSEIGTGTGNYSELFLSKFIPLNYSFGYNPFAKMVYLDTSASDIASLEKKLENSNDPRLKQRLLAYYTKEPPTVESLDILRKRARDNPKYSEIYKVTLEDYLYKNLKKEFVSDKFGVIFFYPQHWEVKEEEKIKIEGDYLIAFIYREKLNNEYKPKANKLVVLKDKVEEKECLEENKLCGVYYSFKSFSLIALPKKTQGFEKEIGDLENVLKSMRFISE